jgi:hypothetical protein
MRGNRRLGVVGVEGDVEVFVERRAEDGIEFSDRTDRFVEDARLEIEVALVEG